MNRDRGSRPEISPRPSSPGRKILTVIICLLFFCVSFVVCDRLLFIGLRSAALRHYASLASTGTLGLERNAVFGRGEGDLLLFGTSRTRHALNLGRVAARLNMRVVREALAGRFPRFSYFFYERYRRDRRRPKVVVYGLDYFMFDKKTTAEDLAQLGVRISADDLNPHKASSPSNPLLSAASWLFRLKPELDTYLASRMKLGASFQPEDDDGVPSAPRRGGPKARPRDLSGYRSSATVRPGHFQTRAYRAFPGEEGEYFERLLARFEQEGLPVYFLVIPDYVATNETNFQQKKFKADLRNLAARHKNIRILDFNAPDRFDLDQPEYFLDGDWGRTNCHLSPQGTEEFSRRLIPVLRRSLIRGETGPDQ